MKLKTLSGDDLVAIFERFGFAVVSQKGTHMKLRRMTVGTLETLVVPRHPAIRKGTLKAIFDQACRYIPKSSLHENFYTSDQ